MPKKPKRTTLRNKADKLFSLYIRDRDRRCRRCGKSGDLQCAHGFSRSYHKTRWDERNAWAMCRGCHTFFTHRPIQWEDWMREDMGEELYEEVRRQAKSIGQKVDLEQVVMELEEMVNHGR